MKRKAIERIKPKKPEGKGLTASLQELGEILILNIYQAKELLVRYCINYETGEHEYWKEQHGWRKGGILNALNEDWRDWEWRTYDDYPKLQKKDANRIKELIRHRAWNNSPWERINGLEHSYNSEIRERCETNRKIKLMNLMRKVPGRPKNLREWFFEQAAGEDYMFRNRETKEFVCTNCGESSWPEEIKRRDGEKKIRHNDMVFCPSCGKLVRAKTRTDHIEQKWKSCYLIQPVDEDTSVLRIIEAKVGWDNGRHYVELGDEIRILLYKVYSNRKLKKTYMPILANQIMHDYLEMKKIPSKRAEFITKRMDRSARKEEETVTTWQNVLRACYEGETMEELERKIPRITLDTRGQAAVIGIDYADVRDFVSAGVLTKTDDGEWIWRQRTWICADSPFIDSIKFPLRNAGQAEFEDFEVVPGPVIDVNLVVDWCMEQMRIFDIKKIAMDTYRYTLFKQAFEEREISIEDKKNPHGIVRLIRKITSATGIIAPFIQSMFSQGMINFGPSAIMRWYTNNTSVSEDKFGNKNFGKIEPKLRKNDGFMAFDVAMFCKDELEVQIIYV